MSNKCHSGPPPSVGWWPAGIATQECLRWWNGDWWSRAVWSGSTSEKAASAALMKSGCQQVIKWRHRPDDWPERSKT